MQKLNRLVVGIVIPAFVMAGSVTSSALAQDKAAKAGVAPKVLLDNAKVRVQEVTWKPGEVSDTIATASFRVVRALKGGTIERTYTDGKKETIVWKTGEVRMNEPGPAYTNKNIGKTEVQLYVVLLK